MHVLVIPSWYPKDSSDVHGSFFREQVLSLQSEKLSGGSSKMGVIYPTLISVKKILSKKYENRKGLVFQDDEGLATVRYFEYDIFSKFSNLRGLRWRLLGHKLFEEYIKKFGKPDLLHAHSLLYGGVLANELYQKYGVPFIVTEHASGYSLGKYDARQIKQASATLKSASRLLAVSPNLAKDLQKVFLDSEYNWEIVPNCINSEFQNVVPERRVNKNNEFVFLAVALLTKNKSVDTLIRAFSKISSRYKNFVLRIGGDGPERARLEDLCKQLNLEDRISFLGRLDRHQVIDEMSTANMFTLSSNYETFGVVVVEALACGLPVISTRCGGPESIVNDCNGFLVPTRDEEALAEAMVRAYEEYSQFDAQRIRQQCLSRYSAEVVTKQLMQIYKESVGTTNEMRDIMI